MLYVLQQEIFLPRCLGFGSFDGSLAFKVLCPKLSRTKEINMHRYKKEKQPVVLTELLEAYFLWLFRGKAGGMTTACLLLKLERGKADNSIFHLN